VPLIVTHDRLGLLFDFAISIAALPHKVQCELRFRDFVAR
jgi:hypothetical protein